MSGFIIATLEIFIFWFCSLKYYLPEIQMTLLWCHIFGSKTIRQTDIWPTQLLVRIHAMTIRPPSLFIYRVCRQNASWANVLNKKRWAIIIWMLKQVFCLKFEQPSVNFTNLSFYLQAKVNKLECWSRDKFFQSCLIFARKGRSQSSVRHLAFITNIRLTQKHDREKHSSLLRSTFNNG